MSRAAETEFEPATGGSTRDLADGLPLGSASTTVSQVTGLRKVVYYLLAGFFLMLGILGAILPGLPTTPFLLLMSYFLIRVSPKLHRWVLSWPLVGKPLREWNELGGVRPGVKWLAVTMVALLVSTSLYFATFHWGFKCGIVVLAGIGLYVVYRLPTIRPLQETEKENR